MLDLVWVILVGLLAVSDLDLVEAALPGNAEDRVWIIGVMGSVLIIRGFLMVGAVVLGRGSAGISLSSISEHTHWIATATKIVPQYKYNYQVIQPPPSADESFR